MMRTIQDYLSRQAETVGRKPQMTATEPWVPSLPGADGDCFDRYIVRYKEIRESVKIIRQAIEKIPQGELQAKVPRVLKAPKGQVYSRAENPKGEFGYYIVSEGGRIPYRLKIRSTSFSNLSILPWILQGQLVPDLVAIMGSLDFVLGDVDR